MSDAGPGPARPIDLLLPAFDEEEMLAAHLAELRQRLDRDAARRWRILVIDDGSRDATAAIVAELARRDPALQLLRHDRNRGLGAALRTGFAAATGEALVTLDADLSYGPEVAIALADRLLATGADLVVASPYAPGGAVSGVPPLRLVLSRLANRLLASSLDGRLTTSTSLARAYSRRAVERLRFRSDGMDANLEIVAGALAQGLVLAEIPAELAWRGDAAVRSRRSSWRQLARQAGRVVLWSVRLRRATARGRRRPGLSPGLPPAELGA